MQAFKAARRGLAAGSGRQSSLPMAANPCVRAAGRQAAPSRRCSSSTPVATRVLAGATGAAAASAQGEARDWTAACHPALAGAGRSGRRRATRHDLAGTPLPQTHASCPRPPPPLGRTSAPPTGAPAAPAPQPPLPAIDSFEAFAAAAARGANVVPLYRRLLSDQLTPVMAYRCLVGEADVDAPSFLLESVVNGDQQGRYSFVGAMPALEVVATREKVTVMNHEAGTRRETVEGDPMDVSCGGVLRV